MRLIAGLASRRPGRDIEARDLLALARHAGAGSATTAIAGRSGLVASEAPVRDRGGDLWMVGDLDLTNLSDLRSDVGGETTEDVLFGLYRRHGPSFVARLEGGFALGLWDAGDARLLAAVDRVGIGRLYYAVTADVTAFASRLTALGAVPGVDGGPDPTAVFRYLNFGYVPAPESIVRGIRRLPPGHLLVSGTAAPSVRQYWDVTFEERRIGVASAAAEVQRRMAAAVTRAMAGGPVKQAGAFLSGGTDSSTVVGVMSHLTHERVPAFSIGFGEQRYDELEYATLAAKHFGAEHHTHVITAREAFELLPSLVDAYDEPFGNDSAIGTAICARVAAEAGMTRLLAGDGGDEIFGGNERYHGDAIFGLYQRLPRPLRRLAIEPLLAALPDRAASLVGRAKRYVRRANIPNPRRFYSYEFHFLQHADELLAPDFVAAAGATAPLDVLESHWQRCSASELNRLLYLDLKLTIGDNDLYKVTRTAELAGLRIGFPMLDPALVDFMATLPARYKVRGLEKRYLFRRAFRELLPAATLGKRKHGFGVPVPTWLRDDPAFSSLAHDALLESSARTRPWFRAGALAQLFRLHATDTTTFYGSLLWTVLMLELWLRRHAEARSGAR